MAKETKKDLAYYLTLFKIEGHQTYRANLGGGKSDFDRDWNSTKGGKRPKITEKRVYRVDGLTGEVKEVK